MRLDEAFADCYRHHPAFFIFVWISPAQDMGLIDYYLHYLHLLSLFSSPLGERIKVMGIQHLGIIL